LIAYVWRDLVRNPRRTLASLAGVVLGVGLFSGVLFFIDGSGASMTKRALAPLAIDMQRVLSSPLGGGLRLEERLTGPRSLRAGQTVRLVLRVRNDGAVPANEVVVDDEPPAPLRYVRGTTTRDGRAVRDPGEGSPLAQGLARTGLNIGTVPARTAVTLTYLARATRGVPSTAALRPGGKISTRESVVPTPANARPQLTLEQLQARVARIPGVAAADGLAFVDLPPGSARVGGRALPTTVRLFAFDRSYQRHYPSIKVVAGSFGTRSALLSAEAGRALRVGRGTRVELSVPGARRPLALPVGGLTDLSRARPLFYSRKTKQLEDFLYLPNSVVVSPQVFRQSVIPAYRAATAARGSAIKSLPLLELDVKLRRSLLRSEPADALRQTKAVAGAIRRVAPRQDDLIDNASNTLQVARDDAVVGKRMFVFLGLPGALLAAFLAAYTGSILAATQRREQATLRIRGAHRGHLVRMLLARTVAIAGAGSVLGACVGFLSVLAILGGGSLFEASAGDLLTSGLVGIGFGLAITALALYIPGRRSLGRQIGQERGELSLAPVPAWRRYRIDLVLLAIAGAAEAIAFSRGAFDAPAGSVYSGQAVSLPSHLLIAPVVAWFAGMLLAARVMRAGAARAPLPSRPRFGPVIRGTLARSLRRRSWALATGTVGVGLVIAFGVGLAIFAATYDAAKASDAKFTVGSDLRLTPSVLSSRRFPPSLARQLRVGGVAVASPVVFKLENSVLVGPDNQDRKNLAALDPASFQRVAPLADSFFAGRSAASAMAALRRDPHALLVQEETADDLNVEPGDDVKVLLARGTKRQKLRPFRVAAVFKRFPGFPEGVDVIANLGYYVAAIHLDRADFYLARTIGHDHAGLERAVAAIRSGPGREYPLTVDSTETTLDKDQSSLTALNVRGLVDLDSLYTLLMSAAAIAIFVFGLMLQRRREYVTLRAQGMQTSQVRALVLGETALVAGSGLVAGIVVGTGLGYLLVHVLRPLFILRPEVTFPVGDVAVLVALAVGAALASALTATAILGRLRPTELLREG
jgi:putative ABC transport system permease protein